MTEQEQESSEELPEKRSKRSYIIALVLLMVGTLIGFLEVRTEFLTHQITDLKTGFYKDKNVKPISDVAFVPIDQIIIQLRGTEPRRHLKFRVQLEVDPAHKLEVQQVTPRISDVLNTYLRAVDLQDFEDGAGLPKLRAQLLRRIQIVTGKGKVRDLLVMEFLVN